MAKTLAQIEKAVADIDQQMEKIQQEADKKIVELNNQKRELKREWVETTKSSVPQEFLDALRLDLGPWTPPPRQRKPKSTGSKKQAILTALKDATEENPMKQEDLQNEVGGKIQIKRYMGDGLIGRVEGGVHAKPSFYITDEGKKELAEGK